MHNAKSQWIVSQFPEGFKGNAVDCGANDGIFESNTKALEDNGWQVLCVEADYRYAPSLMRARTGSILCAVGAKAEEWADFHASDVPNTGGQSLNSPYGAQPKTLRVPVLTLNQILHICGFPHLDVLSMDIEGGELDALHGIDLDRWTPKVILAELFGPWPDCQPYLEAHGYHYVETIQLDKCYVRNGC